MFDVIRQIIVEVHSEDQLERNNEDMKSILNNLDALYEKKYYSGIDMRKCENVFNILKRNRII